MSNGLAPSGQIYLTDPVVMCAILTVVPVDDVSIIWHECPTAGRLPEEKANDVAAPDKVTICNGFVPSTVIAPLAVYVATSQLISEYV